MVTMNVIERMRRDWDRRAREDAYFYAGFARRKQSDAEFFASAADTVRTLEGELARLRTNGPWSALEIGCGPGRLMGAMSGHFSRIDGVDISEAMVALAREFEQAQVLRERFLAGERGAVDPREHRVALIAAPVRPRDAGQLEGADKTRRRYVRPATQIHPVALPVD